MMRGLAARAACVADAQTIGGAGGEILHDDVGAAHQVGEHRARSRVS